MNELLQQFVLESRELIESASDELGILERSPQDQTHLDAVLRSLHTLKGGAGIVGFGAMERTMHAVEEMLSATREQQRPMTAVRLAQSLACADQVIDWLETIDRTGELPQVADQQADQLIATLRQSVETAPPSSAAGDSPSRPTWFKAIARQYPDLHARAQSAVRFVPAADSFYHAEDPLARMMSLPGLVALECVATNAWGPLEALDPFLCNLTLTALSTAPASDLVPHFSGHTGVCDIASVAVGMRALPPTVVEVIEVQQALLSESTPEEFVGRVASAGLVAANALRFCGHPSQADSLVRATEQSLGERSAQPLQQALIELLGTGLATADSGPSAPASASIAARTVRIDAERIEALVRLAGEFAVVKNAIGHLAKLAMGGDPSVPALLKDRHAALERLIEELQSSVLALRVRPLRTVLQRFPRLVREMAVNLGKPVDLTIEGDSTEADKAIVEMLFEPLLHLVRNALDHGVERRPQRAASGKPPTANLRIRAQRLAGQVLVEVSDDGAGIDVARVTEVAKARGIVTEEALRTMSEADILELIFEPGFSTATEVTHVSGRGVGMDAVRQAVERVGGKATITSQVGQGTNVKLLLPFSVMMMHVMTVEAGGQMFGLPLEFIIETARVPTDAIGQVGSARVVVLRDRTIPLVDLATLVGGESLGYEPTDATVVVLATRGDWGAVRVDRVGERLDLMLKPLDGLLAGTPGIAGTTLLGDGRVLLVLDVGELLQ